MHIRCNLVQYGPGSACWPQFQRPEGFTYNYIPRPVILCDRHREICWFWSNVRKGLNLYLQLLLATPAPRRRKHRTQHYQVQINFKKKAKIKPRVVVSLWMNFVHVVQIGAEIFTEGLLSQSPFGTQMMAGVTALQRWVERRWQFYLIITVFFWCACVHESVYQSVGK